MNIDFPLILLILVVGSGSIWALDAVFAAGPRRQRIAELQQRFPRWEEEGSGDARKFTDAYAQTASEPDAQRHAITDWIYWQHIGVLMNDAVASEAPA